MRPVLAKGVGGDRGVEVLVESLDYLCVGCWCVERTAGEFKPQLDQGESAIAAGGASVPVHDAGDVRVVVEENVSGVKSRCTRSLPVIWAFPCARIAARTSRLRLTIVWQVLRRLSASRLVDGM